MDEESHEPSVAAIIIEANLDRDPKKLYQNYEYWWQQGRNLKWSIYRWLAPSIIVDHNREMTAVKDMAGWGLLTICWIPIAFEIVKQWPSVDLNSTSLMWMLITLLALRFLGAMIKDFFGIEEQLPKNLLFQFLLFTSVGIAIAPSKQNDTFDIMVS